jgi:hypothetical protein
MMLISTTDLGEQFLNGKRFQYVKHWYLLIANIENWQQHCLGCLRWFNR